jgi:hypothetical protein
MKGKCNEKESTNTHAKFNLRSRYGRVQGILLDILGHQYCMGSHIFQTAYPNYAIWGS